MIIQSFTKHEVEPLLALSTELIQQRSVKNWREATITSEHKFGMMLTTLGFKDSNDKFQLVEIPTECCEKFKAFRDEFIKKNAKPIQQILLKINSSGIYELSMK